MIKFAPLSILDFINLANNAVPPPQKEIDEIKPHLTKLLQTNPNKSEEHHKNAINYFLKSVFDYDINTSGRIDSAIFEMGKSRSSSKPNPSQTPPNSQNHRTISYPKPSANPYSTTSKNLFQTLTTTSSTLFYATSTHFISSKPKSFKPSVKTRISSNSLEIPTSKKAMTPAQRDFIKT